MTTTETPKANSKWRERGTPAYPAESKLAIFRVMGVIEGYVAARRTGCIPFLCPEKEWHRKFVPATATTAPRDEG